MTAGSIDSVPVKQRDVLWLAGRFEIYEKQNPNLNAGWEEPSALRSVFLRRHIRTLTAGVVHLNFVRAV